MSGNYQNGDESPSFREMLLDEALPELYRNNAFRVLGLPVRSSEREIRKYLREIELRREFGGGDLAVPGRGGNPAPLPLNPPPDAELVAEAQARIARPERRFVDEFFWFWSSDVEPLTALMKNDIEAATNFWIKQTESSESRWATVHDMAVMFHAAALDIEWAANHNIPVTEELAQQRDKYWKNSIAIWRLAISREEVWEHLAARVEEIDDPRVTPLMAKELRKALSVVLLSVSARLAARASQRGAKAEAQRHNVIMLDFNFDEESVDEARQIVVEPLRRRIYDLCQSLNTEARSAPECADQPIQRVLKQSRPLLIAINDLLPERDARIIDARDAVAVSASDAAVGRYELLPPNATREWELAKQFFERLRVIAASAPMRQLIDQNIAWAAGHLPHPGTAASQAQQTENVRQEQSVQNNTRQTCWFCKRLEDNRFPEVVRLYKRDVTQNQYYYDDIAVPRCSGCYAVHSRVSRISAWGGIAGVAAGLSVCVGLLANFWAEIGNLLAGTYVFHKTVLLLLAVGFLLLVLYSFGEQLVYKKVWPNMSDGKRPLEHRMSFPRIAELQGQGWSAQKPNN
jgi:hypothetical protein